MKLSLRADPASQLSWKARWPHTSLAETLGLPWFRVGVAPRGSHRQEHGLRCMRRHLPPLNANSKGLIRVCYVYSAHLQEEIRMEAFARGCVLVYHGGGCAGVLQCNDTHLHQKAE